jgi:2-polyprenyl-3-methyl-5-hydroxy-6-metoxy-1,4-benzoquinol methylase
MSAANKAMATTADASEPKRSKAERFWDRLARNWGGPTEEPEKTDTKVTAKTRQYLKATDTVLDYGCASGGADFRLAGAVRDIHGIDISSKMIAAAKARAEAAMVDNVSFAKATIFDDALQPESFDVVLAFNVFHLLEDGHQVMRRIGELLKPGGLLVSVTPCLGEKGSLAIRITMALVRLATVTKLIPHVQRYRMAELRQSVEEAGLVIVEVEELVHSTSEYFVVARNARPMDHPAAER